jgi:mannose-6-phosphate isomerase-like protein (cupin superfamily)
MIEKINLKEKADSFAELFQYLEVGRINGHILNGLQVEDRTLDFHVHDKSDEMFYCIEGEFDIEFVDGIVHLCEGDSIIVPKGTSHRPVCKGLVKCLLIEKDGTLTKENTGGTYDDSNVLLENIDKIRITELGIERIKRNLGLESSDILAWSVTKIKRSDRIIRKGKNWYVYSDGVAITINANSYTIITAHKKRSKVT